MRAKRLPSLVFILSFAVLAGQGGGLLAQRATPYWASISADEAKMRTGPGRQFPSSWRYVRPDLPVKVIQVHEDWRKIEDPDGTQGWMLKTLLSDIRTAIIRETVRPIHVEASENSRVAWRAEPGVVGRISRCTPEWCQIDIRGRGGYIRTRYIWGAGNP